MGIQSDGTGNELGKRRWDGHGMPSGHLAYGRLLDRYEPYRPAYTLILVRQCFRGSARVRRSPAESLAGGSRNECTAESITFCAAAVAVGRRQTATTDRVMQQGSP